MKPHQEAFLRFIVGRGALRFGSFKTKSGRLSPYFFNAGGLHLGSDLVALATQYADAIAAEFSGRKAFDILYGPAYKGIGLAVSTAMMLHQRHSIDVDVCFNRKEAKEHGEKGQLIGRQPRPGDRILIIDDVVTAGTSVRESLEILSGIPNLEFTGLVVALDRQEKGQDTELSAVQQIERDQHLKVFPIATFADLLAWTRENRPESSDPDLLTKMEAYRRQYGVCGV